MALFYGVCGAIGPSLGGDRRGAILSPNSDTVEDDDELYDCVEAEGDDGDDVYEDLMRADVPPSAVSPQTPAVGSPFMGSPSSPLPKFLPPL